MSQNPDYKNKAASKTESWENFGKNIDNFLDNNKNKLAKCDFNVITGFSRGGAILSTILHSRLTDKFPYYGKNSNLALRNIPSAISTRDYREPCFVMGRAASSEDLKDLDQLIIELGDYRNNVVKEKTINLLLVDDNLTGSTRMNYFTRELRKNDFINVITLAYVRHPSFHTPKLDFTIRDFPKKTDFFIMPWHKPHKQKDITVDKESTPLKYKCNINSDFNLKDLFSRLVNLEFIERIEMSEDDIDFKKGESQTYIERNDKELVLFTPRGKFYPPKSCLDENVPAFDVSLCELGGEMNQSNICRTCSFLNCNEDVIYHTFYSKGVTSGPLISFIKKQSVEQTNLISLTKIWFDKKFEKISSVEKFTNDSLEKEIGSNPFTIPFHKFKQLSIKEWDQLSEKAYNMCKEKIEETFRRNPNVEYVVVCDGEIILTATDPSEVSNENLERLIMKIGKPCYFFSRELQVEESSWNLASTLRNDYYPTIELIFGHKSWSNEEVKTKGKVVVADFDTGNPFNYVIFNGALSKGIFHPPNRYLWWKGWHLNKLYRYYNKEVKIGIKDEKGKFRCKELPARFVPFWGTSSLLKASPNRQGFIGRFFMPYFNFRVTLDPALKKSFIEYIS